VKPASPVTTTALNKFNIVAPVRNWGFWAIGCAESLSVVPS
jgi:hypothetical protein